MFVASNMTNPIKLQPLRPMMNLSSDRKNLPVLDFKQDFREFPLRRTGLWLAVDTEVTTVARTKKNIFFLHIKHWALQMSAFVVIGDEFTIL